MHDSPTMVHKLISYLFCIGSLLTLRSPKRSFGAFSSSPKTILRSSLLLLLLLLPISHGASSYCCYCRVPKPPLGRSGCYGDREIPLVNLSFFPLHLLSLLRCRLQRYYDPSSQIPSSSSHRNFSCRDCFVLMFLLTFWVGMTLRYHPNIYCGFNFIAP